MLSTEMLYRDFASKIENYIWRRVSDPDVTTDLTSETFCKAAEAIACGKGPRTSISGWLYRVAHNLVIDYYRKRDRQPTEGIDDYPHLISNDDLFHTAELIESTAKLKQALSVLTDAQRQVIIMRYIEGYSFGEIATTLGITEGAAKALRYRALCSLQARMAHAA